VDVNTAKNTGNIAKQTVSFNGLTNPLVQTYKYDSLYRLTEARETSNSNQTWKEAFSYDRYGNRIGHDKFVGTTQLVLDNKTHPTIDANTNRFNPNQGYVYDKNGNLTDDAEGRTFIFNGDNKQRFVVQSGKNVGEYFYDGEGKRVKKKVYELDGINVKEETVFVYSAGKLVAEYSTKPPPTNPTTSYTATDQLGSPRVITDSNGQVISRRDFMPFGEEIVNNIGERLSASLKYNVADSVRQKFTGYEKDDETNLDFAEARMYENRHGRFTAVDPLLASGKSANPQSFNRFTYCLNNPLKYSDPNGLQAGTWAIRTHTDGSTTLKYFNSEEAYLKEKSSENIELCKGGGCGQLTRYNEPYVLLQDQRIIKLGQNGSSEILQFSFDNKSWDQLVGEMNSPQGFSKGNLSQLDFYFQGHGGYLFADNTMLKEFLDSPEAHALPIIAAQSSIELELMQGAAVRSKAGEFVDTAASEYRSDLVENGFHNLQKGSVQYDMESGRFFRGVSGRPQPTEFAPTMRLFNSVLSPLKGRLGFPRWLCSNCAEFRAVNNALLSGARRRNIIGTTFDIGSGATVPNCQFCRFSSSGTTRLNH
jgi:RHS repeat-associated protein